MSGSGPSVVVIVPVLRRPHRAAPLVESIRDTCTARVLFVASPQDTTQQAAAEATGADLVVMDRMHGSGDYARKINAGYRASDEDLIFIGADDLRFHPGWLESALGVLEPGIGVVGTNDLGSPRVVAGEHATHCLVTRTYVDAFGTIDEAAKVLHEGYRHNFVDDELVGTAKARNAWAFASGSRVEHLHPSWAKAEMDATYKLGRMGFARDRVYFRSRVHLWEAA